MTARSLDWNSTLWVPRRLWKHVRELRNSRAKRVNTKLMIKLKGKKRNTRKQDTGILPLWESACQASSENLTNEQNQVIYDPVTVATGIWNSGLLPPRCSRWWQACLRYPDLVRSWSGLCLTQRECMPPTSKWCFTGRFQANLNPGHTAESGVRCPVTEKGCRDLQSCSQPHQWLQSPIFCSKSWEGVGKDRARRCSFCFKTQQEE